MKKKVSQILNDIKQKYLAGGARVTPEIRSEQRLNLNPVFVFQMGRVGSVSVQSSLINMYQSLSIDVPVFHGHYLDNFELLQSRAEQDLADPSQYILGLEHHRKLRKSLVEDPTLPRLKLISLVRDIVARNVSTFFYALPEFIPDWEQKLQRNSLTVDYLHEVYLSKNSYKLTALNWFDEQLKAVFDIDVYETPFPTELGYKIYSSPKADLLVMRLESLIDCAEQAIREFLGLHNFKLSRVNTGDERKTAELQRLFKSGPLPLEYVKRMYGSRLSSHFYTKAELDAFIRYWTRQEEPK